MVVVLLTLRYGINRRGIVQPLTAQLQIMQPTIVRRQDGEANRLVGPVACDGWWVTTGAIQLDPYG
jgi:hypothetical protein